MPARARGHWETPAETLCTSRSRAVLGFAAALFRRREFCTDLLFCATANHADRFVSNIATLPFETRRGREHFLYDEHRLPFACCLPSLPLVCDQPYSKIRVLREEMLAA